LTHLELSRLRTLALAVISLTTFEVVTPTLEDQAYFRAYNEDAQLEKLEADILRRVEVLLNVEKAESEREQERRDNNLNTAVIFLTGTTALTTLWDAYEFLRGEEKGITDFVIRVQSLVILTLVLVFVLTGINSKVRTRMRRRRSRMRDYS